MTRPRVVHLVPAAFGSGGVYGGAERYATELARAMARVTPTTLVAFGPRPRRAVEPGGLRVVVLAPIWEDGRGLGQVAHPGLAAAVAAADVVHCHQHHALTAEAAALLGRATGRAVFASDLGGGFWGLYAYTRTDGWFRGHLHISEYSRTVAGHADRPDARVIYGGVDPAVFSPDPVVSREPTVVFVGRLMPHQGVHDLIEALPDGLALELVGRPYHDRYRADLGRLAAGKRVTFRTECDDAEVVRAYRRALCVVLPSVYKDCYRGETRVPELLGQTALEGMACGAPAVVTDVASLPEVVADGRTGFVVRPNDPAALRAKLEWLRDRPAEAAKMGAVGREWVLERFSWPAVVERCLAAYQGG